MAVVGINISKKDVFNSRTSAKLKDAIGVTGILEGCAVNEREEGADVAVLKIDGQVYSGISGTTCNDIKDIIETFSEEVEAGTLKVSIIARQSNNGRQFITVEVA